MNKDRRQRASARDIVSEACAAVLARPLRAALTASGTVIGIAALIATIGISSTASHQIVAHIDALDSRIVTAQLAATGSDGPGLRWDVQHRLGGLHGVEGAGAMAPVDTRGATVRSVEVENPTAPQRFEMTVLAITPGMLGVVDGRTTGRFLTTMDDAMAYPVVVLGAGAARRLGIGDLVNTPAVLIGDVPFTVVGILTSVAAEPSLLDEVLLTPGAAHASFAVRGPSRVLVKARPGATSLVGTYLRPALDPGRVLPGLLVRLPPDPRSLRHSVQGDLNGLLLLLGVLSLVIGAIGITNVTLVTVLERTSEIGLRRALGASRAGLAAQVLVESTIIGAVGGVVGASLGVLTTVATATVRDWVPVLNPIVPLAAPLGGALVGLLAGLYPAIRAGRMEPATALRV